MRSSSGSKVLIFDQFHQISDEISGDFLIDDGAIVVDQLGNIDIVSSGWQSTSDIFNLNTQLTYFENNPLMGPNAFIFKLDSCFNTFTFEYHSEYGRNVNEIPI